MFVFVRAVIALSLGALFFSPLMFRPALASPSPLVQPGGRFELGVGMGLGHNNQPDRTGLGFNLELKYGLGGGTELGFRTGARNNNGIATSADAYARPFDRETFGTGGDTFANPELRLRKAVMGALALEGRAYVPFDGPFGIMLAVPIVLASGGLRLDTGVYVPIIFADETQSWISIPLQLWFVAGGAWDVGIISGARLVNHASDWQVPIGVGLDRTLSAAADLVMWFLFPDVTRDSAANQFGGGVGLRIRI